MDNQNLNKLMNAINELQNSVLEFPAPDYASYLEMVGRYRGLKTAVEILTAIEDDNEDF